MHTMRADILISVRLLVGADKDLYGGKDLYAGKDSHGGQGLYDRQDLYGCKCETVDGASLEVAGDLQGPDAGAEPPGSTPCGTPNRQQAHSHKIGPWVKICATAGSMRRNEAEACTTITFPCSIQCSGNTASCRM